MFNPYLFILDRRNESDYIVSDYTDSQLNVSKDLEFSNEILFMPCLFSYNTPSFYHSANFGQFPPPPPTLMIVLEDWN